MKTDSQKSTASLIASLANKDAMALVSVENNLSIDAAINGNRFTELTKVHGDANVLKACTGLVVMSLEFFNVKQPMTSMQAVQTVSLLMDMYPHETIEDLMLCLKYAKSGQFGHVFNRIDGQVVFDWFRQYLDMKYERFEQIKHNEKYEYLEQQKESLIGIVGALEPLIAKHLEKPEKLEGWKQEDEISLLKMLMKDMSDEKLTLLLENYERRNKMQFGNQYEQQINTIKTEINGRRSGQVV